MRELNANIQEMPSSATGRQSFRTAVWLWLIILGAVVIRIATFGGILGADDVSIAGDSLRLLDDGPYLPMGHYAARVGLIYPLAAIFGLVGVGEWQFTVINFIASILGVYLAYDIASRLVSPRAGLVAALLIAVFPLDVANATSLLPDLPTGTALAASFALALRVPVSTRPYLWALLAGLVWGYAWLIKVEAFFMAPVFAAFLWQNRNAWRPILLIFIMAAAVVFAENLIYWLAGGKVFHRVYAAMHQGGGKLVEEYSGTSLWTFPKAWFVTFYSFGLHYYAMFFALSWIVIRRTSQLYLIWIWIVVFLLWLQFGGNPFAETYTIKTHLQRYCTMIDVPMAVLIAAALTDIWSLNRRLYASGTLITLVLAGLFFVNFNTLSNEREQATKRALDLAIENDLFPLYLDRTSAAIAEFYLYNHPEKHLLTSLQQHDFRTSKTRLIPLQTIDGYILLNRGFMDFSWKRYRMDEVSLSEAMDKFELIATIDNPGNKLAYAQTRLLSALASVLPGPLNEKIRGTANNLLMARDAVLLKAKNP